MKTIEKEITALRKGKLSQAKIEALKEKYHQINQKSPKNKPSVADVVDHIDYMFING
ncbi:MAG: hypothetical protein SWX82_13770 [Cyanobacteriota bacterium]|nr:hypothetical protein [Cyanobacteriota bacterium]